MIDKLAFWWAIPWVKAVTIVVASLGVAYVTEVVICRVVLAMTRRTQTEVDDQIVEILRRPLFLTVLLAATAWAAAELTAVHDPEHWRLSPGAKNTIYALIRTAAIVVWAVAAGRIGKVALSALSRRARGGVVQPRTLPAIDILLKLLVLGSAVYFAMLAWNINVSGWLASAGILGLVLGLAAKDTLANLFAGIFIIADAPYKIGDYITFDDGLRGEVTDIGVRSTRILTRNDVQITIPNAMIGNSKIVNESGGPHEKERVPVRVSVAYGSSVDRVREALLSCPPGAPNVCDDPAPRVRFREFGDSGLVFDLLVWIESPWLRGRVIDELNQRVYEALGAAGIEIPYSKHDVYIKEMPASPRGG